MMKKLLNLLLSLAMLSLNSITAMAHPGHLTNESLHGYLHAEHIILFTVVGLVTYAIKRNSK